MHVAFERFRDSPCYEHAVSLGMLLGPLLRASAGIRSDLLVELAMQSLLEEPCSMSPKDLVRAIGIECVEIVADRLHIENLRELNSNSRLKLESAIAPVMDLGLPMLHEMFVQLRVCEEPIESLLEQGERMLNECGLVHDLAADGSAPEVLARNLPTSMTRMTDNNIVPTSPDTANVRRPLPETASVVQGLTAGGAVFEGSAGEVSFGTPGRETDCVDLASTHAAGISRAVINELGQRALSKAIAAFSISYDSERITECNKISRSVFKSLRAENIDGIVLAGDICIQQDRFMALIEEQVRTDKLWTLGTEVKLRQFVSFCAR